MPFGGRCIFKDLPDELALEILSKLDSTSLGSMDATCKLNRARNWQSGMWRLVGARKFVGMELEEYGPFDQPLSLDRPPHMMGHPHSSPPSPPPSALGLLGLGTTTTRGLGTKGGPSVCSKPTPLGGGANRRRNEKKVWCRKETIINWKLRFANYLKNIHEFRAPFDPMYITSVLTPDEVAYTKCRLRADVLMADPNASIYLEVEVEANPDNLSLSIVDFDEGGKSSVTFSPDTGAVIKETKVQENPRRVKGCYIQPVKPNFTKFQGKVGLYVKCGMIAFFRKYNEESWESTGYCVNFNWAKGTRLTPCLAFRDEGRYMTSISKVSSTPPFEPTLDLESFDDSKWDELNWEGGQNVEA